MLFVLLTSFLCCGILMKVKKHTDASQYFFLFHLQFLAILFVWEMLFSLKKRKQMFVNEIFNKYLSKAWFSRIICAHHEFIFGLNLLYHASDNVLKCVILKYTCTCICFPFYKRNNTCCWNSHIHRWCIFKSEFPYSFAYRIAYKIMSSYLLLSH